MYFSLPLRKPFFLKGFESGLTSGVGTPPRINMGQIRSGLLRRLVYSPRSV